MRYFFSIVLIMFLASCGGGGGGGSCNVAAGSACPAGEYCAYLDGSCGLNGASGSCTAIPTSCNPDAAPVCTCDQLTFTNECFASQAGQSFVTAGECA